MDAYSGRTISDSYASAPPVLVAGASTAALDRARGTIENSGLRIADTVLLDAAADRIGRQARASALWIELDRDPGADLDAVLDRVRDDVHEGRFPAIVAAPASLLDPLAAQLPDEVQLVIDGNEADRAAALAIATSGVLEAGRLSDVASDQNTARLRQLSDEVSRIAATLARLSATPAAPGQQPSPEAAVDVPDVSVDTVRTVIRARRLRDR